MRVLKFDFFDKDALNVIIKKTVTQIQAGYFTVEKRINQCSLVDERCNGDTEKCNMKNVWATFGQNLTIYIKQSSFLID